MTFVLVALGAAVAVSVELLEALAIVLARRRQPPLVGRTHQGGRRGRGLRRPRRGTGARGAGLGLHRCAGRDDRRLLLLFGLESLRKGTLRLAGRRARSPSLAGAWLRKPLSRIPETELKWGVGVLLSSFGVFFAAEGLGVHWPGSDAALLYLVAILGGLSQAQARWLARTARPV